MMKISVATTQRRKKSSLVRHDDDVDEEPKKNKNENLNKHDIRAVSNKRGRHTGILMIVASLSFVAITRSLLWQKRPTKDNNSAVQIFIGVKASLGKIHKPRMEEIRQTWLEDVKNMDGTIDLRFFCESPSQKMQDYDNEDDPWLAPVLSKCNGLDARYNLCCKDESMFQFYYDHYEQHVSSSSSLNHENPFTPWFCSFDDDSYVLVNNLYSVLQSYQQQNGSDNNDAETIYVGKPSTTRGGFELPHLNNEMVYFLTGGAGYCMSRKVMMLGKYPLLNLTKHCQATQLTDDMAIGHVINAKVGVGQRVNPLFHSHMELLHSMPRAEIPRQVSFGYDTKHNRSSEIQRFPNVPILYSEEEDPMLFRSLRVFLQNQ